MCIYLYIYMGVFVSSTLLDVVHKKYLNAWRAYVEGFPIMR